MPATHTASTGWISGSMIWLLLTGITQAPQTPFHSAIQRQDHYMVRIARIRYQGGGDWYASPTALPNLIRFCNQHLGTQIAPEEDIVQPGSPNIFQYPFLYMTGHGRVYFSLEEARNLRRYLERGGFLLINDSYGMDKYIRQEIKKIFPERPLELLSASHEIFRYPFAFPKGLPKIHKHSGKPPQALGIHLNDRLVLLYVYESDIGDGWEDPSVHGDPEEKRLQALRMGANIIYYAFTH